MRGYCNFQAITCVPWMLGFVVEVSVSGGYPSFVDLGLEEWVYLDVDLNDEFLFHLFQCK